MCLEVTLVPAKCLPCQQWRFIWFKNICWIFKAERQQTMSFKLINLLIIAVSQSKLSLHCKKSEQIVSSQMVELYSLGIC